MKRAWEMAHLAAVWLLIGIAFFCLARVWMIVARATGSAKDFWDVATAIGTCGAVVVALYVASRDSRRKARAETLEASLTAAGLTFRIGIACGTVDDVLQWAEAALKVDTAPDNFKKYADQLEELDICSMDELRSLIALPENCAKKIAGAKDRLHVAIAFLRAEEQNRHSDSASRKLRLKTIRACIGEAHILLNEAGFTCERESRGYLENAPDYDLG
ncbi:hypothetical protein [Burkholderia lata]|uniref:hypothetical protein n=1 Tax=Burkholderia lata (strain ATCC 17760 / DSM 23089 / LMG 22485 / NCIMB 9086 / R18194 / 383) TaxID=482957 RepID=UPI00145315A5|nr:hypothetical protein [Burkholderia lata]VWB97867.1 hypothetical protein BLA15816_04730 [Burkholderia lata]